MSRSTRAIPAWRTARARLAAARDELASAEVDAGLRAPAGARWRLLLALIAAVVVAGAGVAVWQAAAQTPEFTDAQIVDAARDRTELLLTADADDPGRARQILNGATGEFQESFAQSAEAYTDFISRLGTQGTATIDGAALVQRGDADAVVLVVASVRVGTDGAPADTAGTQQLRLRVVVTPEDGVLKLSGVRFVE